MRGGVDERTALLVLLGLKTAVSPAVAAQYLGVDEAVAAQLVETLAGEDLVVCSRRGLLVLTTAGRLVLDAYYASEAARLAEDPDENRLYTRFERVNEQFLRWTSAWQAAGTELTSADGLQRLAELDAIHERLQRILEGLRSFAPRLSAYLTRFRYALDRIDAGERDWVARPDIPSYHTLWFELHQDWIRSSGRTRGKPAE